MAAISGAERVGCGGRRGVAGGVWTGEERGVENGGAILTIVTGGGWLAGVFDGERGGDAVDAGVRLEDREGGLAAGFEAGGVEGCV